MRNEESGLRLVIVLKLIACLPNRLSLSLTDNYSHHIIILREKVQDMLCQSHFGVQLMVGLFRIHVDSSVTKQVCVALSSDGIMLSYFNRQERWSGMNKLNASKIRNIMRPFALDQSTNSLEIVLMVFRFQGVLSLQTSCFLFLVLFLWFPVFYAEHFWFTRTWNFSCLIQNPGDPCFPQYERTWNFSLIKTSVIFTSSPVMTVSTKIPLPDQFCTSNGSVSSWIDSNLRENLGWLHFVVC